MHHCPSRRLNPAKLLHSQWTAVNPRDRERHFIVTRVVTPPPPAVLVETIDMEAVISRRTARIPWRTLLDTSAWLQGWQ